MWNIWVQVREDSSMYLAALKKHFDWQERVITARKHIMEQKMVAERRSSTQYAVRNGDEAPSFAFPNNTSNLPTYLHGANTASLNQQLTKLVCDPSLFTYEAIANCYPL